MCEAFTFCKNGNNGIYVRSHESWIQNEPFNNRILYCFLGGVAITRYSRKQRLIVICTTEIKCVALSA